MPTFADVSGLRLYGFRLGRSCRDTPTRGTCNRPPKGGCQAFPALSVRPTRTGLHISGKSRSMACLAGSTGDKAFRLDALGRRGKHAGQYRGIRYSAFSSAHHGCAVTWQGPLGQPDSGTRARRAASLRVPSGAVALRASGP